MIGKKYANKFLIIIIIATVFFSSSLSLSAFAQAKNNGIVGSTHDFTVDFWNYSREICRVCHVPHDHNRPTKYYLNGLLWNHAVSGAAYTMYNSSWSSTLDNTQESQPEGIAKLCLGCHDGTVGIDTFDKYAGGAWDMHDENPNFVIPGFTDGENLDLRGTHPISIVYDESVDTNLNSQDTTLMGNSGYIRDILDSGKVQCSSCHDVHDQETVPGTHLLRVAQMNMGNGEQPSGLCLTCHIK